jgi:tRNA1Val (adenine37-N6)-methyltransferase
MDDRFSEDHLFNGRLHFSQPCEGYRFSIDALIVSACMMPKPGQRVLDLGTGCGVIPIILAYRHPDIQVTAVEIQAELAALARLNVCANGMHDRIEVIEGDMRKLEQRRINGCVDWVVCNPPYRRPSSGRINPNTQRAVARHEIHIDLIQLVDTTRSMLKTGGCFVTIYPCERMVDLISAMRDAGIEPKWLRSVHSFKGEGAKRIVVQGIKGGRPDLVISDPLVLYDSEGTYSAQVRGMLTA